MGNKHQNRLFLEKSPYLIQHALNPVDWYVWGDEAFARAKSENKPIFLSIGYSTCHWCHVMERESFEDPEVSRLMNETFISIKVDREERPDIDSVYMQVCQLITGSGGWPLTIIMTPDKEAFFAATYIPKESKYGHLGMLDLIPRIRELWSTRHTDILSSATQITMALREASTSGPGKELGEPILHFVYQQLVERFDEQSGGFGGAPKFATPHNLLFLLRYWARTGDQKALYMVEKTLEAMRNGGLHDHIGFGFHRYSTDPQWLVPHFEKMLYDQAMLALAYTEMYQATGKVDYAQTAHEIFTYVMRDMTAPEGGFYSAEDADSDGEEGMFYLWKREEINHILSPEEAILASRVFNIHDNGNFIEYTGKKNGKNILQRTQSFEEIAYDMKMSIPELQRHMEVIRQRLFVYREKRIHPHKDDKILTDWNGLMIAAFARGARVLHESRYASAAEQAVQFIMNNMITADGRLLHRYRDGQSAIPAYLDDYACLIYGMIELYETTFDTNYLEWALAFNRDVLEHFWDKDSGGFFFTADDSESLLIRQKEVYDGAVPSGNSVAMLNLLRLGRITANPDLDDKAAGIGHAFTNTIRRSPSSFTQLMVALDFALGPTYEVVLAGDPKAEDMKQMLEAIQAGYIPNKVVIFRPMNQESPEINHIAPFAKDMVCIDGKATAYVCRNYSCELPTTDVNEVMKLFNSN
jgi:uncharacterized protein YyaL (SSP411 family)